MSWAEERRSLPHSGREPWLDHRTLFQMDGFKPRALAHLKVLSAAANDPAARLRLLIGRHLEIQLIRLEGHVHRTAPGTSTHTNHDGLRSGLRASASPLAIRVPVAHHSGAGFQNE